MLKSIFTIEKSNLKNKNITQVLKSETECPIGYHLSGCSCSSGIKLGENDSCSGSKMKGNKCITYAKKNSKGVYSNAKCIKFNSVGDNCADNNF